MEKNRWKVSCLYKVVQAVLGHLASAASIERDFSRSGILITGRRSSIEATFLEMILFLAANYELIPPTVPAIRRADINSYVPKCLSDLRSFKTVNVLSNSGYDDDADDFEELGDDGDTGGDNEECAVNLVNIQAEDYPDYIDEDIA